MNGLAPVSQCVEDGRTSGEDFVESCLEPTMALKNCMESNPEYYSPVLEAEKTAAAGSGVEGDGSGSDVAHGSEGKAPAPASKTEK